MKKNSLAAKLALSALMVAVSITFMLITSITGLAAYAGPVLASIALVPVLSSYGYKICFWAYAACSILGLLLLPDREMALFYLFFAHYPIECAFLNTKVKKKPIRIVLKLLLATVIYSTFFIVTLKIVGVDYDAILKLQLVFKILFIAFGLLAFLGLDIIYGRANYMWKHKYQKNFKL